LYGGTYRLFSRILVKRGIHVRYVDFTNLDAVANAITDKTKLVFLESPTNPLLQIIDIVAVSDIAHRKGALVCVDNSTMSPYLQRPLELGADIVLHSATKFLCGHSDVMAGAVVVADEELGQELYLIQNGEGAVLAPFDSYLLLRGTKTLSLRLDRQQSNARAIAELLDSHPAVDRVYYPGLANARQLAIHRAQSSGDGAVLSFATGDPEFSRTIVEATKLFAITVSFGGVNSTISLPNYMSHASIPAHLRQQKSIPADLVRISVGAEDVDDLIDDLSQALEIASRQPVELRAVSAD
jgi:cystathionine beta-lyase